MYYTGSKKRIAKKILQLIQQLRSPGQTYVEPFIGGANLFHLIDGTKIGNDRDPDLVLLLNAVKDGWNPPQTVTEGEYRAARHLDLSPYRSFVAFTSWGGKKWGGYRREAAGTNYFEKNSASLAIQAPGLVSASITVGDYRDIVLPSSSFIYCDPPYQGTTGYAGGSFDTGTFWQWAQTKAKEGHTVLVSEYQAPEGWEPIWSRTLRNGLNGLEETEQVFRHLQ